MYITSASKVTHLSIASKSFGIEARTTMTLSGLLLTASPLIPVRAGSDVLQALATSSAVMEKFSIGQPCAIPLESFFEVLPIHACSMKASATDCI